MKPRTAMLMAEAEGKMEEYLKNHPEDMLNEGKDITARLSPYFIAACVKCPKCAANPILFVQTLVNREHIKRPARKGKAELENLGVCAEHALKYNKSDWGCKP
jgi:hypothetical protein